jgi:6-oxo-cyclohex-1-ene-carbonyl-CoA hydrolase
VEGIRAKKKYFWDQVKNVNRHWLAANMATEAYMGFAAFNSRKMTGRDVIDFQIPPNAGRGTRRG